MNNKIIIVPVLFLFLWVSTSPFFIAHAFEIIRLPLPQGSDFIVSPVHFDFNLAEKGVTTSTMFVVNHNSASVDFIVSVEDVGGGVSSAREWITSELPIFTLRPNEKISFQIGVHVPLDTPDGMYYARINVSGKAHDSGAIHLVSQITVPLYILIDTEHTLHSNGMLKRFSVPFLQEDPHMVFRVMYGNSGNAFMKQRGGIVIKKIFGMREGVEVSSVYILPGEDKLVEVPYVAKGWGIYRATLSLENTHASTRFFFILPLKALCIMGILILVFYRFRFLWIT